MMKRAIWIIVIILIGGYFVNNYLQNKATKEAEKAEAKRIEETIKTSVAEMVARTNAIETWEKDLSKGEKFRLNRVLTVDLERMWLTERPILFVGAIKDIATLDKENYRIEIERGLFSSLEHIFGTELQLALQCPKQRVDSFLKEHPDLFKGVGFENGVAVVANIDEIETIIVSGSEGEKEEIKVGKGKCIDMVYAGEVWF